MQKIKIYLFFLILISSCGKSFKVQEYCYSHAIIDGEYGERHDVLYLPENNKDAVYETLDTMYLKVEKATNFKFKLKNKNEFDSLQNNPSYDLESYVYMKRFPFAEKGLRSTLVIHKIPLYTEKRINVLCPKDVSKEILDEIRNSLSQKGYEVPADDFSNFEGELKAAVIQYQKDKKFPYGKLDIRTLQSLGIRVKI